MHRFSTAHLTDAAVLQGMKSYRGRERSAGVFLIAYIAEADERRLFVTDACDSMAAWCRRELGLSEDEALKRIHAGRVARRFPQVFAMLEDGRLHMTALNLLAPHLTEATADALIEAACGKSKSEIQLLLAARFPEPEPLPLVLGPRLAPEPESSPRSIPSATPDAEPAAVAPERPRVQARVRPHASDRYTAQLAWNQATEDELRECEALLSHQIPPGHRGEVIALAIHRLVLALRTRVSGATNRPRATPRPSKAVRHIPAHVRRAVHARDGGRCTYVNDAGQRCGSRTRLQYDHIVPVARGGESTIDNVRQRCAVHNQYTAEREFGAAFMAAKRSAATAARLARSGATSSMPRRVGA